MNLTKLSLCVLATTLGSLAFAQSSKLKGRVLDENGNPLSNVKLYMKDDPQTQVITDEKGNYFLNPVSYTHLRAHEICLRMQRP